MLRIYATSLEVLRESRPLIERVASFDRDLARQLRRASVSVVLNLAEGAGSRGGRRRARYDDALGSARESLAGLEAAEAVGYLGALPATLRRRFDEVIGTLVRLVR